MTDDPKMTNERQDDPAPSSEPGSRGNDATAGKTAGLRIKIGSQRESDAPSKSSATETPTPDQAAPPVSQSSDQLLPSTEQPGREAASVAPADTPSDAAPPPRISQSRDEELQREIDAALADLSIDDLMGESKSAQPDAGEIEMDQRRMATVVKTDRENVFFDLGGQREGIAARKQFQETPEAGTRMEVVPTRFSHEDNLFELVVPGASVEVQDWADLSEGVVVEARVTGHNKGGLECEVNRIRGFIPISQISLYRVDDLDEFVGEAMQCVVTECNPDRRNLVLSHRAIMEREREESRKKLLAELEPGQVREGVVRRIQDFGAFVDLGGVDGLVHVSQLSWDRIAHPSEVIQEGQTIKVRVEKVDPASGRIGLSYRDLMEHPWDGIEARFPMGAIVDGVVTKIMDFGAFVKVAPGIEGLVHISELAHHRVTRVNSVVQEGKQVQVKVLSVEPQSQRMSLSIKAAQQLASPADEPVPDGESAADEEMRGAPRKSNVPLKGGLGRDSGGEQFGLNW